MAKNKNPHAVALGRKGGLKGGKARWSGKTEEERKAHASMMGKLSGESRRKNKG